MPNQATEPTVQTTQTVQTEPTQNSGVFDPSTLSPEALAWVDRQRTQASQTARANAKKDLMKDENFLNEVRGNLQPQVQQTVEQQMQTTLNELQMERSQVRVERILNGVVPADQMDFYVGMLASSDIESSVARATDFVNNFNNTIQTRVSQMQQQAVQSMPTPQVGGSQITEQERLQSAFDQAKKDTSPKKGIIMSSIMREAQEKGIILK